MNLINQYLDYLKTVRRYSLRTVSIYKSALDNFVRKYSACDDHALLALLNVSELRSYQVHMLDAMKLSPKTVNLNMSVLSGFCRFLIQKGELQSNPVTLVTRPKVGKRIPEFFRREVLDDYFNATQYDASEDMLDAFRQIHSTDMGRKLYERRLARLIIAVLYGLGIRRAELIGMNVGSVDFGRKIVKIRGKGDK